MIYKKILFSACLLFSTTAIFAQDDLSKMFDTPTTDDPITATFKTTRLNMAHSIETVGPHQLDFRISHVFGAVGANYGGGVHNLWGLPLNME